MSRLTAVALGVVALATGTVGCTHCDTCDDFPTPCIGQNCGYQAGFADGLAGAPIGGAPMGGAPVMAGPNTAMPVPVPADSQPQPAAPIESSPSPGPFAPPASSTSPNPAAGAGAAPTAESPPSAPGPQP